MINTDPEATLEAVRAVFAPYDVPKPTVDALAAHISTAPDSKLLPDFLMHFHHREPEPESSRALVSGLTIALGYFLGGLLPLLPYVICRAPRICTAPGPSAWPSWPSRCFRLATPRRAS